MTQQQVNEFDSETGTNPTEIPEEPPVGIIEDEPTSPPADATGPGHYGKYEENWERPDGSFKLISRTFVWVPDPAPTEGELKGQLAREMLVASQAAQAALVTSLGPLRDAVAKLDPAAIREPDGFEFAGFAIDRETEMNQVRMAMGDLAEAVRAASGALEANATANELSVAATVAVLDAVPSEVALTALDVVAAPDAVRQE